MLTARSLFLYGYQITENNRSIDFKITGGGMEKQATLTIGYYSLGSLLTEVKRALEAADPTHIYTCTADRTYVGGTENRVTISTNGVFLSLLFLTGSRNASTSAYILGYTKTDKTGATSYLSQGTSGTALVSDRNGFEYLSTDMIKKNFGSVNISASGIKEAIIFNTMSFWQVRFKYIKFVDLSGWTNLMTWLMAQRLVEFTPEISSPTIFFEGTIETTTEDGKGLGFRLTEMIGQNLYTLYDTGILKFRQS